MDMTLILVGIAAVILTAAVILWIRHNKSSQPTPEPSAGPSKAEVALQIALKQAIDKLHASTPAAVEKSAPATPAVQEAPLGTTAPTWEAPPPPWPIDARYLSAEQIAALTPEQEGRANLWQQALMSAAASGNAQNPVPAALMIYRAGFTKTEDLNKPLDETWQRVFQLYGVPLPVIDPRPWTGNPSPERPSDAAYDVRLQK